MNKPLTHEETGQLLRLALAQVARLEREFAGATRSASFWQELAEGNNSLSHAYSGELHLIAEDLGVDGIAEIRDKIHELRQRVADLTSARELAERRAVIASETYNGQQQSYRELETLYQAAQERAIKAEAIAKQHQDWARGAWWECESCGARFPKIGPAEAYEARRCGVCIELAEQTLRAEKAEADNAAIYRAAWMLISAPLTQAHRDGASHTYTIRRTELRNIVEERQRAGYPGRRLLAELETVHERAEKAERRAELAEKRVALGQRMAYWLQQAFTEDRITRSETTEMLHTFLGRWRLMTPAASEEEMTSEESNA